MSDDLEKFLAARDFLLNVGSYQEAKENFEWPHLTKFNWALDYFDHMAKGNDNLAVICADENGKERKVTFEEMRQRSNQVANFLRDLGLMKGDRVIIMMETAIELFEILLGIMKAGGAIIPAATSLPPKDVSDRIERGNVKFAIVHSPFVEKFTKAGSVVDGLKARIVVGDTFEQSCNPEEETDKCWTSYKESEKYPTTYESPFITYSTDDLFLFFTSGTTSKPKLVIHTHTSYPVGHLTTMYWIGVRPGDVHYNISAPGWAKYAWSTFFAPWNAGATILTYRYKKFIAKDVLDLIEKYKVTTLCAPLSVLKLFTLEDLGRYKFSVREFVSAGEPLNPEVVKKIESAFGVPVREGYGQTETTAMVGNFKGEPRKEGSMGKSAPGYNVVLLNEQLEEVPPGEDGQISVEIYPVKPLGLLKGYDDEQRNREIFKAGWYFTGDAAYVDEEGYFHFIGRTDDVFKSLDYRISPFEVESELMAADPVMEAAVVPTVDDRDRIVPKAFIVLKPDYRPGREAALDIFRFIRDNMAPYKRPRSIEFMSEFPKTVSMKVMRRELRAYDRELKSQNRRGEYEFFEKDFAEELELGKRR
jgi:acetyl-CoA synthetase